MEGDVALVVGMGLSGEAAAGHLLRQGWRVIAIDDSPSVMSRERAQGLGVELLERPDRRRVEELVARASMVAVSPGVAHGHPVHGAAGALGVPVLGEMEIAWRDLTKPVVAVTGTNGKTTVTTLVTRMLAESGVAAVSAGNIGLPLSSVVGRDDVEVVVAEVSSFQLRYADRFRPSVAVWLNVAADHLDWHGSMDDYVAAKARIWVNQQPADVALVNADDPVVLAAAASAPSRVETFGLACDPAPAEWHAAGGLLRGPIGILAEVDELPRARPHDLSNALAAAAAASAAGATLEGIRTAIVSFAGLRHRLELVADVDGVRWFDDSKATNPHAAVAAVESFESVVLLAGGRNKGLDLSLLVSSVERIRAVVAIGEAAGQVGAAFAGRRPVRTATSMDEAVRLAANASRPGDAVLLSPACASFDWYDSYRARGDDFARAVRDLIEGPR